MTLFILQGAQFAFLLKFRSHTFIKPSDQLSAVTRRPPRRSINTGRDEFPLPHTAFSLAPPLLDAHIRHSWTAELRPAACLI